MVEGGGVLCIIHGSLAFEGAPNRITNNPSRTSRDNVARQRERFDIRSNATNKIIMGEGAPDRTDQCIG